MSTKNAQIQKSKETLSKNDTPICIANELQLSRYTPVLYWDRKAVKSFWALYDKAMDAIFCNIDELREYTVRHLKDGKAIHKYMELKCEFKDLKRAIHSLAYRMNRPQWVTSSFVYVWKAVCDIISKLLRWLHKLAMFQNKFAGAPTLTITWEVCEANTFSSICHFMSSSLSIAVQPLLDKLATCDLKAHAQALLVLRELCDNSDAFKFLLLKQEWKRADLRRFLEAAQKWCRKFQYFIEDVAFGGPM